MFIVYGFGFKDPIIFVWVLLAIIAIYKGFKDYRHFSPWYGVLLGTILTFIIMLLGGSWIIQSILVLSISILSFYISNK